MPIALDLTSPQNGTAYHVTVEAPDAATSPGPWPAVVVLDGHDQFAIAAQAYQDLRTEHRVLPLLLVGVGYGVSYRESGNRRGRDYTPTRTDEEPESGGADAFLAFLGETLWPELHRRWPVSAKARGIAGHSIGALCALHALFQMRPFFTHHLASAPSIWWDHRAILCQAERLREAQVRLPARLWVGVGSKDSTSMQVDLDQLVDQLEARPFEELRIMRTDFPGRTHFNVLGDAYRAGLAALFGAE